MGMSTNAKLWGWRITGASTGTSSGLRDALAAGWNARYAVVTWVGRFDGGSDPALMGSRSALPILDSMKDSYADNFDFMNLTFCVCVRIVYAYVYVCTCMQ